MKYAIFTEEEKSSYPVCLLVPIISKKDIEKVYCTDSSLDKEDLIVIDLHIAMGKKKTPKAEMKEYIESELVPVFNDLSIEYILCGDSEYFRVLTDQNKTEANLGYVMDCAFSNQKVIYVPNFSGMFYNPEGVKAKIEQALKCLSDARRSLYAPPGTDIIEFAEYPLTDAEIQVWLDKLLAMNQPLSIDIEAFGLKHNTAGIGTITFCWSKTEGIAFPVDYEPINGATEAPFGKNVRNEPRRRMLRAFFEKLQQTAMYHSISYDAYVLIYQLFMKDILDTEGLLYGMEVMLRNWHCTKLITYLATNSCAGNDLSLKTQAQEYAGNYAQEEIKDITKIPLMELLEYNLVDGLSTWFTYEKNMPIMLADNQNQIYVEIFKPAMVDIIQMQLTGLPVNMDRVNEVSDKLDAEKEQLLKDILSNNHIQDYVYHLNEQWVNMKNNTLKKKRVTLADAKEEFNPNSGPQLQDLLFNILKLPVLNLTKSKQPSTNGETLESLQNHTTDQSILDLLDRLYKYKVVEKLTSSFIPALKGAALGPDGWYYLFGNFNLGGTLSGRLSSSDPNLQNLPSTGKGHKIKLKYAKMIKGCFQAPPGWLFCGVDFSSLEDRISALTTKDPNKLKVYTDGYDGHSLRAYAYFGDQMEGIDPDSVESINSIAKKYKPIRDRSKNPTFTLTYQGTFHALVKKYGFTVEQAKEVEAKYHELYKVSDDWVNKQLDEAMTTGYITGAFGLRLRTPLLKQVIRGNSKTPYEAEAEGRTAGNALGQSWCLLNSRAGIEFNAKVRQSVYRLDIRPCAQIHDAQYHLIRDDIGAILFTNEHLIQAVQWQDHPDIWHDEVKLGGELSIFFPTWNDEITIENGASEQEIFATIEKTMLDRKTSQT